MTICLGVLAAAIGLTAYGLENVKEKGLVPQDAERQNPALTLKKLGQRLTPPARVLAEGETYSIPFEFQPTTDQFMECTIIDANQDNKTWTHNTEDGGSFKFNYHSTNAGDDWCILPTISFPQGSFKLSYKCKTASYKESFKICLGKGTDIDSYTTVIAEQTEYQNTAWVEYEDVFSVEEAGDYNIGLYGCSKANMYWAAIQQIKIVKLDDNQPNQPEATITSVIDQATMTIKLPTKNYGGYDIQGTVGATVYYKGQSDAIDSVTGLPGEEKVINFTVPGNGVFEFSVVAYVEVDGETISSEPYNVSHRFTKFKPEYLPLGFVIAPDEDDFSWCEIKDANDDGQTWNYQTENIPSKRVYDAAFRYYYSSSKQADDWLILPAYDGTEGGAMEVSFLVGTKWDIEGLEVAVASSADIEDLSENIIWSNMALKTSDEFVRESAMFTHTAGEPIFVGFHVVSMPYRNSVFVQDITVNKVNDLIPQGATLSDPVFDGGDGTIKLTMPTYNIGGNEIQGSIYADVMIDGDIAYSEESIEGTAGEEIELPFTNLSLGGHVITATPYVLDEGEKLYGVSADIELEIVPGSDFCYTLPMDMAINSTVASLLDIVDANGDNHTWSYTNYNGTEGMKYSYNSSSAADDWFITYPIDIPSAEKLYEVTVYAKCESTSFEERFEVMLGKERSVEGMTIQALNETGLQTTNVTPVSGVFAVPEAGRYYMGVHCTSAKNMYALYITRIELKESDMSVDIPGKVTDLTATGNITGALNAVVDFTFPAVNMVNQPLPADQVLTATVTSGAESKEVTGTPGQAASVELECPEGITQITVKVSNEIGEGLPAFANVNCGLDIPKAPVITGYTVSEDNGSVTITWEAVTEGVNGGNVNPGGIDYYLWEWDEEDEDWYQIDVTDQLSGIYEYSTTAPQAFLRLGVQCYNGLNSGSSISSIGVVLGKPYDLPMTEDFADGQLHNTPVTLATSYNSEYAPTWSMVEPSTVVDGLESESGYALYGHTSFNKGDSYVGLPKFSTVGIEAPAVSITTFTAPSACTIQVIATTYGMDEYVVIGEVELPATNLGWVKHSFALPANFVDKNWVDVKLVFDFVSGSSSIALLDSYVIKHDPEVGVEAAAGNYKAVAGLKGGIFVSGFGGEELMVVNAAGQIITSKKVSDSETISVAPGIYMVKTAAKTFKVVVK